MSPLLVRHRKRGVALDLLERHVDAQACYRAVLASTPRHVSARNNLALSLALSGQFAEALDIYRDASAVKRLTMVL